MPRNVAAPQTIPATDQQKKLNENSPEAKLFSAYKKVQDPKTSVHDRIELLRGMVWDYGMKFPPRNRMSASLPGLPSLQAIHDSIGQHGVVLAKNYASYFGTREPSALSPEELHNQSKMSSSLGGILNNLEVYPTPDNKRAMDLILKELGLTDKSEFNRMQNNQSDVWYRGGLTNDQRKLIEVGGLNSKFNQFYGSVPLPRLSKPTGP